MAILQEEVEFNCNGQKKKHRLGKRKREIKPIISKTSKQVTFSKRRKGLFKRAGELNVLCGVEIAVITFSNAGKLFAFGHPNVDDILHRFVNFPNCNLEDKNHWCNSVRVGMVGSSSSSNGSSSRGNSSTNRNNDNSGYWWDAPINDNMGLNELERLKVALEGLRAEVVSRIDDEINRSCLMSVLPQEPELDLGSIDDWDFCL